jgi:hypothetical protein
LLECYSNLVQVQSENLVVLVKEQCLHLGGFLEMLIVCAIEVSVPESIKIYVSQHKFNSSLGDSSHARFSSSYIN